MDACTNFKISGTKKQLSPSKCDFCCKVFHNRYVRDFHVNNFHNIGMFYTCYICLSNPEVDESDIYYRCLYSLYAHKEEFHEEKPTVYIII